MPWFKRFKFPKLTIFQWAVHIGAWIPLALIVYDGLRGNLTANPIQAVTFRTGKPALVLLILALAATPVNTVFGFKPGLKVRRALGLYAFMYVSIHFLIFIGLDYGLDLSLLKEAILEKRYALVGFAAALILLPLALTSTKAWMARLGRNWKRLQRLVYMAGILAIIHYVWLVKSDIREPLVYGAIVILLLILRIPPIRRVILSWRSKVTARLRSVSGAVIKFFRPGEKIHPKIIKNS